MPSRNEQDYLRIIYELLIKSNIGVRISDIATALNISKPSVTEMMHKLEKNKLVERKAYNSITLTEKGIAEARKVLRRHRILEVFFANVLGLGKTFHREAHAIEHSLSDEAEVKLDSLLKHPKLCPDGDEIPPKNSKVLSLGNAPQRKTLKILFSKLEKKTELDRIRALGIIPNETVEILKHISGGPLILKVKGTEIALGKDISSRIYVEVNL
jgi:DtxR family Mn-dependent transcriptional regulator